ARLIIHEVFHWLKIPNVVWWVTDRHDYWTRCGPGGYRAVRERYRDDALYLGRHGGCDERNHRRAVRANDTYAFFARELGRRVYAGTLREFPEPRFWLTRP
ncbi:MAG: hypothetical protein EA355_05585, partial [Rhodobacteraceae bacterium]